jgi:hypothetical protein
MNYTKITVAAVIALFLLLIVFGNICFAQSEKKVDVKQARLSLSTPEIVLPDINLSDLTVAKIDMALIKQQLEIISAKRKELAEFERHFKTILKLQRGTK